MAKPGGPGSAADPSVAAKAADLRRELRRLVKEIAEDERCGPEAFDRASRTLMNLRDSRFRPQKAEPVPGHFICPMSAELMRDPVVVATGQTYERRYIQKWLDDGNLSCPQTNQVLAHVLLTPNVLVRNMIAEWCLRNGVELPSPIEERDEEGITQDERLKLSSLLQKAESSSMEERKEAVKELRSLTKRVRSFRALIGETPNAVSRLLSVLCMYNDDCEIQEDVVTTILNLSIHEENKRIVGEIPDAIPLIIGSVKSGNMKSRSNAAAALFSLSALDSNKSKIGEFGAMEPLVELVKGGDTLAKKDAASAIFNLCALSENRGRAVAAGAVGVIAKMIKEGAVVDEMIAILAILVSEEQAVEEMAQNGAVAFLLKAIRERNSGRSRENAVAILCSICASERTKLREIKKDEEVHGSLSRLAQNGTSRAKRKANSILEILRRSSDSPSYSGQYFPQSSN